MFYALYGPGGTIKKVIGGISADDVQAYIQSECPDCLALEIDRDITLEPQGYEVDESTDPPSLVARHGLTAGELRRVIVAATQSRLDEFAQTRGYDSILSAATYATSSVPQFAFEGQRAVDLRDQTWATLYQMLEEVQAETRAMPTGFVDIEDDLPALTWS